MKKTDGRKYRPDMIGRNNWAFKHGMLKTPEHRSWRKMHRRCSDKNDNRYSLYGGRGIKVCERWNDFLLFLEDMGARPTGFTLHRKDNDRNYEPGNCTWETQKTQQRNRRNNHIVTYAGISLTMAEWAEIVGLRIGTLWYRLKAGWTVRDALFASGKLR